MLAMLPETWLWWQKASSFIKYVLKCSLAIIVTSSTNSNFVYGTTWPICAESAVKPLLLLLQTKCNRPTVERNSHAAVWLFYSPANWFLEVYFCACYRRPRSGKLPVLFLLTGQKSAFSPRRGDSLHRFRSNFAGLTGTWVRLAVQNFTSIASGGGNAAPKISKISTFW